MLFWFARDPENRIVGSGKADALVVGYEGDLDALVGEELVRIGQSVVGYGWVLDDCPVPQVVDLEVRGFGTDVAISLGDREVARDNGATIQLAPGFVGVRGTHKGAFVRPDGTEWIAATKPGKSGIGCERLVLVSRKVRPFPCKHRFSFERFEHPTLGSRKRWICAVCRWTGPPDYQPENWRYDGPSQVRSLQTDETQPAVLWTNMVTNGSIYQYGTDSPPWCRSEHLTGGPDGDRVQEWASDTMTQDGYVKEEP